MDDRRWTFGACDQFDLFILGEEDSHITSMISLEEEASNHR